MSYRKDGRGSMYLYNATQTVTINTASVYHAVIGLLEGSVDGAFTYLASATGAITDTADNSGTLRCTDVGHGLTTGQIVTLNGMGDAAHNGVTAVTVITEDVFDCDDITYNSASDTGSWQRGSSLTVNPGFGGHYSGGFSVSGNIGTANKNIKIEVYGNTTAFDEFAAERVFSVTGYGVMASGGIGFLVPGDIIWVAIENTTDTTDFVIRHMNLHLAK